MQKEQIAPIRLRPTTQTSIGTTAFFRNRILFDTLLHTMQKEKLKHYDVLFHAGSIGAEVYSFIIQYLSGNYQRYFTLKCYMTDIEPTFVEFAKKGVYQKDIIYAMKNKEKIYFNITDNHVILKQEVRQYVEFLPSSSFVDFQSFQKIDVVFLLNALIYVNREAQLQTIKNISSYNAKFLITSGFHRDAIKEHLQTNSYVPILNNIEEIHESWIDRRTKNPIIDNRPGIYADWSLPKFSQIEDFEYKYCAIFKRNNHDS